MELISIKNKSICTKSIFRFLIASNSQGVNRLSVLLLENENGGEVQSGYYLRKVEIKIYNLKIDSRNFLDHSIRNDLKTFDNLMKIATG